MNTLFGSTSCNAHCSSISLGKLTVFEGIYQGQLRLDWHQLLQATEIYSPVL